MQYFDNLHLSIFQSCMSLLLHNIEHSQHAFSLAAYAVRVNYGFLYYKIWHCNMYIICMTTVRVITLAAFSGVTCYK